MVADLLHLVVLGAAWREAASIQRTGPHGGRDMGEGAAGPAVVGRMVDPPSRLVPKRAMFWQRHEAEARCNSKLPEPWHVAVRGDQVIGVKESPRPPASTSSPSWSPSDTWTTAATSSSSYASASRPSLVTHCTRFRPPKRLLQLRSWTQLRSWPSGISQVGKRRS
eukprot:418009-Rhodomonas_salina.3